MAQTEQKKQDEQQQRMDTQVERARELIGNVREELKRRIVGQQSMIDGLLIGMLAGGHVLLEGVPGLAKTLTVKSLAEVMDASFRRIQFTPDLLPADLIGTMVFRQQTGEFMPRKGPIFSNIILADEINRAPAKVQSALLEAMEEHQVTIGDTSYKLDDPFFVLATQNPIEQEGTYPLPEAQLDRFMFHVSVDYPDEDEELEIVKRTTTDTQAQITATLDAQQITALTQIVRKVPVADHIARYALRLARLTRCQQPDAPDFVREYVMWGAGPRASQYLVLGAKARAVLQGRYYVSQDDIRAVALPVLRHRIKTNFAADAEGISTDDIIRRLLAFLPRVVDETQDELESRKALPNVLRPPNAG